MPDAKVVEWIREKYRDLAAELDERGRRRWTAIEARSLGRGASPQWLRQPEFLIAQFAPAFRS